MDEETKKILADNYALNKENNEMLKKLVLFQKLNQIYRIVYWAIIILSAIGAFYFMKQYMSSLISLYTGGVGDTSSITDFTKNLSGKDSSGVEDMINFLKN